MDLVAFNGTSDYQHLRILGIAGVFTAAQIDTKTLPEGYFVYTVLGNTAGSFDAISNKESDMQQKAGFFITKTELSLAPASQTPLHPTDIEHSSQIFSMEDYFGVKESIDLQISQAELKRRMQSGEELDIPELNREDHSADDLTLNINT